MQKETIYAHTISGDRQTRADWLEEIRSEKYHEKEPSGTMTSEEYFQECFDRGFLVVVEE